MPHVKSPSLRCNVVIHVNVTCTESTEREKPKKSMPFEVTARRGELPDCSLVNNIPVLEKEDVLR